MDHIEVTNDYLNKHKTSKGGWTSKQLRILGIGWPPVKKWKERVIGLTISPKQRKIFEDVK